MAKGIIGSCQSALSVLLIMAMLLVGYPGTDQVQAQESFTLGTDYYVDSLSGSDINLGTEADSAWKTLDKVNATVFQPGDRILLKAGSVWENQTLAPGGSGSIGSPIIIDQYGSGSKPAIKANGQFNDAVTLFNQQYWEIHNLDVSNKAPVTGTFAESLGDYRGIHITGQDAGSLKYFRINGVDVHDVSGEIAWISGTVPTTPDPGIRFKTGWDGSKKTGGIVFDVSVSDPQNPQQASVFSDVVIENSSVKNTSFGGIIFKQYVGDGGGDATIKNVGWGSRTSETDSNFTPHTDITIRNNFVTQKDTEFGCNAMYLTGIRGALVENNVVDGAGTSGIEAYYADNIVIQYNEVFNTTRKAGGADSNGIDPDKATTNILIQYNYIHDNGDGILICQFSFGSTVIRYNVLESNTRYPIYLHSDRQAVAEVYNNTIYNDASNYLIYGYGSSLNATYNIRNNILYTTRAVQALTESPTITYDNNSYFFTSGTLAAPAGDMRAFTSNPQMVNPGSGTSGSQSGGPSLNTLSGYQLQAGSMLINRGLPLVNSNSGAVYDFAGRQLYNGAADLGAFEYYNDSTSTTALAGKVTNSVGKGMSGVYISDIVGDALHTTTDSAGYYFIDNVPIGSEVNLRASKTGYDDAAVGLIRVEAGNVITQDVSLISNSATGAVTGTVFDGELSALAGATIGLSADGETLYSTETDASGKYLFPAVELGDNYSLTASKAGYRTASVSGAQVNPALTTAVPDMYVISKQSELVNVSDFNELETGNVPNSPWSVTSNGGSIGAVELPSASNKSVRITRSTNNGSTSMSQTYAAGTLKGVITLTAEVMKLDNAGSTNWISLPYVYSSAGTASANVGVSVAFSKGQIVAYKGGTSTNLMPYEQNKWYQLRLVMNTGSSKFDLYIDDVLVIDQAAFRNKIPDIGRIDYYANSSNYGTAYIDNIKLYKGIPYDRNEARLESLTVNEGELVKQSEQSYSMEVPYFVDVISLTAAASSPLYSALTVNGIQAKSGQPSEPVMLVEGMNTIPVVLTAEDGNTTNMVNVMINRMPAAMDSTLKELSVQAVNGEALVLEPQFSYNQLNYAVNVSASVYGLTVIPTAGAPDTEVKVNDTIAGIGQASAPISLTQSVSEILVTTSSADGTDYRTYTITVHWAGKSQPEVPESGEASVSPMFTVFDLNPAHSQDVELDVLLNGDILNGIRSGSEWLDSDSYSVADSVYRIRSAYLKQQSVGITSLTFDFANGPDTVVHIEIKYTSPDNGSGGEGNPGSSNSGSSDAGTSPSTIVNGTLTLSPQLNTGLAVAKAVMSEDDLNSALKSVITGADGKQQIRIIISPVAGAASYELSLPTAAISHEESSRTFIVETAVAKIMLPSNMLTPDQAKKGKSAVFKIASATDSSLLKAETVTIANGGRPAVDLMLYIDNTAVAWKNTAAPVKVTVPYTLTEAEKGNLESLTVWYLAEDGRITPVTSGQYDTATDSITFTVQHFSTYAVVMNPKSFADLEKVEWARKSVEALAAKGIVNGVSSESFSPELQVSRADFVMMLIQTLGLSTDAAAASGFADVLSGSYYYEAVSAATTLGIIKGIGNNRFSPKAPITRQEMITMTDRALRLSESALSSTAGEMVSAEGIEDFDHVADYAKEATLRMLEAGWIQGYNGKIAPTANTSRAEAAVLLYNIYKSL